MKEVVTFDQELSARAEQVEEALRRLLPQPSTYPPVIHEAMGYSALGGGKRLRGVLVVEAAKLVGGAPKPTSLGSPASRKGGATLSPEDFQNVPAPHAVAAAVEMLHAYSLIHDDLPCMDDDDVRRGKPTNHRVYGEGIALLAGDALLTRSFEVLSRLPWTGVAEAVALKVVSELATAAGTGGLIGGQVVDFEAEGTLDEAMPAGAQPAAMEEPAARLEYIHAHKTGALFRAAMRMGGIVAGADDQSLAALSAYADHFGLAFQITDDLLDVVGDAASLGKEVGSDERKGKLTFPALYGVERSRAMASQHIQQAKEAIAPFARSSFLQRLADYVLTRDR